MVNKKEFIKFSMSNWVSVILDSLLVYKVS